MTQTAPDMAPSSTTQAEISRVEQYGAHNYHPLPVVIAEAEGAWVTDVEGKRYLDMLAAYSAMNFGHRNPELIAAAKAQLDRVTLTSRAFHNDQLGPFCEALAELTGMDLVLPMNTGAEGVETALKTARKWGHERKGVAANRGKIIVCDGNFHGRTITVVGFSTDEQARAGFGPFTPGFEIVPFGDAEALENAIDDETVAFLFEPIQGEGGIIIPPDGYLQQVREICSRHNVLMIADEIQSGLGRTGKTFACEHENVQPDMYILGKALGGGIMPISAVVAARDILGVFQPGDHGSTFGGNPLACAVARKVIDILNRGEMQAHAAQQGEKLAAALHDANSSHVKDIRARGLWVGVEIKEEAGPAKPFCKKLLGEGLLTKETHEQTLRLAPPLTLNDADLDWAAQRLVRVLRA